MTTSYYLALPARVPRGFEAEDRWADLLKRKSIVARTLDDVKMPPELKGDNAGVYVADLFKALTPFNRWICGVL